MNTATPDTHTDIDVDTDAVLPCLICDNPATWRMKPLHPDASLGRCGVGCIVFACDTHRDAEHARWESVSGAASAGLVSCVQCSAVLRTFSDVFAWERKL